MKLINKLFDLTTNHFGYSEEKDKCLATQVINLIQSEIILFGDFEYEYFCEYIEGDLPNGTITRLDGVNDMYFEINEKKIYELPHWQLRILLNILNNMELFYDVDRNLSNELAKQIEEEMGQ